MITCRLGTDTINCYDGKLNDDDLREYSRKGLLKCPACGGQYVYQHGHIRSPYFKHKNADCAFYSEPETEEHIQGKRDLYNWIKIQSDVYDIELEGWISNTHQRPDIIFKHDNRTYVIEYQCTPIASEYRERHELYQYAGIIDIWILGTQNYFTPTAIGKYIETQCDGYYNPTTKEFTFGKGHSIHRILSFITNTPKAWCSININYWERIKCGANVPNCTVELDHCKFSTHYNMIPIELDGINIDQKIIDLNQRRIYKKSVEQQSISRAWKFCVQYNPFIDHYDIAMFSGNTDRIHRTYQRTTRHRIYILQSIARTIEICNWLYYLRNDTWKFDLWYTTRNAKLRIQLTVKDGTKHRIFTQVIKISFEQINTFYKNRLMLESTLCDGMCSCRDLACTIFDTQYRRIIAEH